MWQFQDFLATQIFREINFGNLEAPKTDILTKCVALNFEFLNIFDVFKCEIPRKSKFKASNIIKMAVFDPLNSVKIDFTKKSEWQENC